MSEQATLRPVGRAQRVIRIGGVSYLNARPLIFGLEQAEDLELRLDVPAKLLDGMRREEFDVALLPVIDYQRVGGLRLIPSAGGIGCDGDTLTVRIFSPAPLEQIESLGCDPDSHTSVALARIVLAQLYGRRPEFVEGVGGDGAKLLIGDKVVCQPPPHMPYQLDLGGAWKQMTGLPFVFAAWFAREGADLGDLPRRLMQAKQTGLASLDPIVAQHAVPRGWPGDVALHYLKHHMRYEIGPRQLKAIELFYRLAGNEGLIPNPPEALKLLV